MALENLCCHKGLPVFMSDTLSQKKPNTIYLSINDDSFS